MFLRKGSLLFLLALSCLAQEPAPRTNLSSFTGTWNAVFQKKTWMKLTLVSSGKTLKGTLVHALQVSADDSGNLTAVSNEMAEDKIVAAEIRNGELYIDAKDSDDFVDSYVMKLTGPDQAELQPVRPERSGGEGPKPFLLVREREKAAPPR